MEYKPFTPTPRSSKKLVVIAIASILLIGLIGYGTVMLLRTVQAPTLSDDNTNTPTQSTPTTDKPTVSPEKARETADATYASAVKKADAGDQKAALVDYKAAYDNYKIANDTTRVKDIEFVIQSIEKALAAENNPIKPETGKASAKDE